MPCGTNKGNMTAAKNKTVISGMPLQNSMNNTDKILTTGNLDLLPRARTMPNGKANTIPMDPKRNVKNKPPHLWVPTCSRLRDSLPYKRKKAIIG